MPIEQADFTVRITSENSHRKGSDIWRAGQIVQAMEGCDVYSIIAALMLFESNRTASVDDPASWLTHFAGIESAGSSKNMQPWIVILHAGTPVLSTTCYRALGEIGGR
jgi:hypothetical protein